MMKRAFLIVACLLLTTISTYAKHGGPTFQAEGKISNLTIHGNQVSFQLDGVLLINSEEFHGDHLQITAHAHDYIFTADEEWFSGALGTPEKMMEILQKAEKQKSSLRFLFVEPTLSHNQDGFVIRDAGIVKMTDPDF